MNPIKVFHASFEYFSEYGAFDILVSGHSVLIFEASFLWCNRSHNSGGAVLLMADEMNNAMSKCCASYCWINSGNTNYKDFGQFVYFSHCRGVSSINESSCIFCSIDKAQKRNAPITFNKGEASAQNINVSLCVCAIGSGVLIYEGTKLTTTYDHFENDTTYHVIGSLGAYASQIEAIYVNFIRCTNEAEYNPLSAGSTGKFSFCFFANCTSYKLSYFDTVNTRITSLGLFDCTMFLTCKRETHIAHKVYVQSIKNFLRIILLSSLNPRKN